MLERLKLPEVTVETAVPGVAVLRPRVDRADRASVISVREPLRRAATEIQERAQAERVIFDLSAYSEWDSEAIAVLVNMQRRANASQFPIAFVVPAARLRIFRLVSLDRVLSLHSDLASALASGS